MKTKPLTEGDRVGKGLSPKFELDAHTALIGRALKDTLPPEIAFFLCLANFGEGGTMTYASSIERENAIKLLREMADKLEKDL